jgi:hypothetical protein
VKVGVEAVEGVVSLLPPTSKAKRAGDRKSMNAKESGRRNCET